MSDEESDDQEMSAEAFYAHVIPSMWIGLLDMCHDISMRLGDFLEVQGKMVEEAKLYMNPGGAEIIPFPTDEEEGA
jgi:hypothetical protein